MRRPEGNQTDYTSFAPDRGGRNGQPLIFSHWSHASVRIEGRDLVAGLSEWRGERAAGACTFAP